MVDFDSPQIPLSADGHEEDAEIKIYSGLCEVRYAVDTLEVAIDERASGRIFATTRWRTTTPSGSPMPPRII